MKRYMRYKDSGVNWIGEIPEHWGITRYKSVASYNDEALSENHEASAIIKYVEIGDVTYTEGIKNFTEFEFGKAPSRARRITRRNDVIVSTVRTYLKSIATIEQDDLIVSTGFIVIRPIENRINSSYISYVSKSEYFSDIVVSESVGITYPAISAWKIMNTPIPIPPLPEQRHIVTYLDAKVTLIDRYISKREEEIARLKEWKQALISKAVTKGLDPNAKMKDSGIAWIGEVPEKWGIRNIKHIFTEKSIKGYPDEPVLCATQSHGVIPQSMYENRVVVVNSGLSGLKLVEKGNFVISLRSFQGGIEYAHYRGIISAAYTVLALRDGIYKEYIKYLVKCIPFIGLLKTCVTGIREGQNINYGMLCKNSIMLPPLPEQHTIVRYIEEKTTKADKLISKLSLQVDYLKEYKQRLISDVVTGKINVQPE